MLNIICIRVILFIQLFPKELYYILLTIISMRKLLFDTQCSDQKLDIKLSSMKFNKKLRCSMFKHLYIHYIIIFSSVIS